MSKLPSPDGIAGMSSSMTTPLAPQALSELPKVRAFSSNAALVVEWGSLRSERAASLGFGVHTLNLEFARSVPAVKRSAGSGASLGGWKRKFDWDGKVVIQLSPQELLNFTAVVLGWRDSLSVRFHGNDNDRGFEVKGNHDGGLYLSMRSSDPLLPMPVGQAERAAIGLLCVKVLSANHPELEAGVLLQVLRSTLRAPNEQTS